MDCYIVVSGVIAVEKMNTILELWLNRVFAKQSSSQIYIKYNPYYWQINLIKEIECIDNYCYVDLHIFV